MFDLSLTEILVFEIGDKCNLDKIHVKCPAKIRRPNKSLGNITIPEILAFIEEAKQLNFNGFIAFHYYNEPLIYLDKILEVIENAEYDKFLLWTNGTLLRPNIEDNEFLYKFKNVVITCYNNEMNGFFEKLKLHYQNITILQQNFDERKMIYSGRVNNYFGCQRPLWEVPIDYWGNLHLCNRDWNESYKIGNVKEDGLKTLLEGDAFQKAVRAVYRKVLDQENCPEICRFCDAPHLMPELLRKLDTVSGYSIQGKL